MNFITLKELQVLDELDYAKDCIKFINKNMTTALKHYDILKLQPPEEDMKREATSMFYNMHQKRVIPELTYFYKEGYLYSMCTINMMDFVIPDPDGEGYTLDIGRAVECQQQSVRIAMRQSLAPFIAKEIDNYNKRDHRLCCSVTGWKDAFTKCEFTLDEERQVANILSSYAHAEASEYAYELRIPAPLYVTGLHYSDYAQSLTGRNSVCMEHHMYDNVTVGEQMASCKIAREEYCDYLCDYTIYHTRAEADMIDETLPAVYVEREIEDANTETNGEVTS